MIRKLSCCCCFSFPFQLLWHVSYSFDSQFYPLTSPLTSSVVLSTRTNISSGSISYLQVLSWLLMWQMWGWSVRVTCLRALLRPAIVIEVEVNIHKILVYKTRKNALKHWFPTWEGEHEVGKEQYATVHVKNMCSCQI